jgi:hypothetical protein
MVIVVLAGVCALLAPAAARAAGTDGLPGTPLAVPDVKLDNNFGATTDATETLSDGDTGGCTAAGTRGDGTGSRIGHTVWWHLTGTGGPITVSTNPAQVDTILAVHIPTTAGQSLVKCNDDISSDNRASELVFNSVQGQLYNVQVGTCCHNDSPMGTWALSAWPPPANDDFASVAGFPLTNGHPVSNANYGATTQTGEDLSCTSGGVARDLGKTVWFSFDAPDLGTATFTSTGYGAVIQVYRAQSGSGTGVGCGFDPNGGDARLSLPVTAGRYYVQVGGVGSGVAAKNGNGQIQVDFRVETDRDHDGHSVPQDCNDNDPNIRPGALEIPGNSVDENCDGLKPDFAAFRVPYSWDGVWKRRSRFTQLTFTQVPAGASFRITCTGHGCPKKAFKKTFRTAVKKVNLAKAALKSKQLAPGAVVEVRITRPSLIGEVIRLTTRRNRKPTTKQLCIRPGASKASKCPAS